jgi:hypothetical protein
MIDISNPDDLHIMLDLETLGTTPGCAILSIGAVKFNHERLLGEFDEVIEPQSAQASGLRIDGDTVLWWMSKSDAARKAITGGNRKHIFVVLEAFAKWVNFPADRTYLWGHGADFDNVILDAAYRATKIVRPWGKYNNRCFRTLKAMHPEIQMTYKGVAHNALDDAKNQARHVCRIYRRLVLGTSSVPHMEEAAAA